MKKVFLFLFIATIVIMGQSDKGKISFIYNDEEFTIPITYVEISKGEDNAILFSFKGSLPDNQKTKTFSIQLGMKNLSKPYSIKMDFKEVDEKNISKEYFSVEYGDEAIIKFTKNTKGEKIVVDSADIKMKMEYLRNEYVDDKFIIHGGFSFELKSKANKDEVAVLKEGKFEIII